MTPRQAFELAQQRYLDHHGVEARSSWVDVPSLGGRAHVLVTGEGPDVVMLNGIGTPGAMWAPLMAAMPDLRLLAVDLPAYGLTDAPEGFTRDLRHNAVHFLEEVLDGLGLARPGFVANSLGGLWASWLALERPHRVGALTYVGCPGLSLGSAAPLPMRLLSVPFLGRLMTRLQPPSRRQVAQLGRMVRQHPLEDELVDLLVATEQLPAFRPVFLPTLHTLIRLRGARPEMALTAEQLAAIVQPAQIFWGDAEPFAPRRIGEEMAAVMPYAELHLVRGGHAPWLTDTPAIAPSTAEFQRAHAAAPE